MQLKCDAVFEGGGVKGIGLVGAAAAVEKAGYTFENLAGTSAGAIVAALLAVGYTALEIEQILGELDYTQFKDETAWDHFGLPGMAVSELLNYGTYKGDFFQNWLQSLLEAKGKTNFGDIRIENSDQEKYTYRFQAIASDITDKRLLVLPGDLKEFGYDPDQFGIAAAVRMSMSIPLFFTPVKLNDREGKVHYIVDGGTLSNYPVWLLDDGTSNPAWPTFGFKLSEKDARTLTRFEADPIHSLFDYLASLLGTLLDGHDNYHISVSHGDNDRTIHIPTTVRVGKGEIKISTTDFNITGEESRALFNNGLKAAQDFLSSWDFAAWKKKYREKLV